MSSLLPWGCPPWPPQAQPHSASSSDSRQAPTFITSTSFLCTVGSRGQRRAAWQSQGSCLGTRGHSAAASAAREPRTLSCRACFPCVNYSQSRCLPWQAWRPLPICVYSWFREGRRHLDSLSALQIECARILSALCLGPLPASVPQSIQPPGRACRLGPGSSGPETQSGLVQS